MGYFTIWRSACELINCSASVHVTTWNIFYPGHRAYHPSTETWKNPFTATITVAVASQRRWRVGSILHLLISDSLFLFIYSFFLTFPVILSNIKSAFGKENQYSEGEFVRTKSGIIWADILSKKKISKQIHDFSKSAYM